MECILSWVFLILGLINKEAMFYITSGLFAIAENCKRKGGNNE